MLLLNHSKFCEPVGVSKQVLDTFFSIFELVTCPAGNNKHLMTGPKGNSEFCFPETSMCLPSGNQTELSY